MWCVIQDRDGPFLTEDKSVMEKGDKLLVETNDKAKAKAVLDKALAKWCGENKDDGPEEFWRDYN